jgi:sugar lactone lactonase YvrE
VPENLRPIPDPKQPVIMMGGQPRSYTLSPEESRRVNNTMRMIFAGVGCIVCLMIGISVASFAAPLGLMAWLFPQVEEFAGELPTGGFVEITELAPTPTQGPASVVFTFGSQGTGPGLLDDARHIAVDPEGNIYVGDYGDGRIQKFDPTGKFVMLYQVQPDPLRSIAVDRKGVLYAVQGGVILRFDTASGQALDPVPFSGENRFDDVKVAADGGLIAAHYAGDDNLVRLDASGNTLFIVENAISGQSGDSELDTRLAMDGLGNIYALGTFNNKVFIFGPDGKYISRFGSDGHEPGQFSAVSAIAVDGQSRVYVGGGHEIEVFTSDGRYLDLIWTDGVASGLAFDDQGRLYVVMRDHVSVFTINLK